MCDICALAIEKLSIVNCDVTKHIHFNILVNVQLAEATCVEDRAELYPLLLPTLEREGVLLQRDVECLKVSISKIVYFRKFTSVMLGITGSLLFIFKI